MGTQGPPRASSLQPPGLEKRLHLAQALAHARSQGTDLGRGLVQVGNHHGHETAGRTGPHASEAVLKYKGACRIAVQAARGLKENVGRRLGMFYELT